MKHGLYASFMKVDEVKVLETIDAKSLVHEVALARIMLRRLARYLEEDDLAVDDVVRIAPIIFTGVRTVAYLKHQIGDNSFDWDEVLDEIKGDWEIEV
jgi:hypothetical protein